MRPDRGCRTLGTNRREARLQLETPRSANRLDLYALQVWPGLRRAGIPMQSPAWAPARLDDLLGLIRQLRGDWRRQRRPPLVQSRSLNSPTVMPAWRRIDARGSGTYHVMKRHDGRAVAAGARWPHPDDGPFIGDPVTASLWPGPAEAAGTSPRGSGPRSHSLAGKEIT